MASAYPFLSPLLGSSSLMLWVQVGPLYKHVMFVERPCAKLTNTTILSYRWFCITGLWNHDPGIPPFFVLWFWFTGFWLFYRGQKQTELMTELMTGTQTKTIISNSRFIWMIFRHQHTWQNCLIKKVQSQNEHKSQNCSAIIKCNHPNFSFS